MIEHVTLIGRQVTLNIGAYSSVKVGGYSCKVSREEGELIKEFAKRLAKSKRFLNELLLNELLEIVKDLDVPLSKDELRTMTLYEIRDVVNSETKPKRSSRQKPRRSRSRKRRRS